MPRLFQTRDDAVLVVFRVVLGVVMFAHGAQKVFGWFGGAGLDGAFAFFGGLGIPPFLGVLAIAVEILGGPALILGLLSRVVALGVIVNMLVAIFVVHGRFGLFMNWGNNQGGEGIEFHLIAISLALAILYYGSGPASVDRLVARRSARF
jgi:putative oxidoreductase